ncbi:hypothetical protein ACI2LM_13430 [Paenibacillus lautus]|uniref:hypothetical protein n=1 Tax=Paenibacillus lautus TaxID=1401 RepID=UPI00384F1922
MEEVMETANHSGVEETPVTDQEMVTTEETTIEGQDSPPQEEPRGIKVKYNKEERFVPEDEVPNWVQKGLNYDKVSEKAQQAEHYQKILDRTARFHGFDNHDDYMAALEEAEQDRLIKQEAEKLNVSEDVIREHMQPMKQKLSEYEQKLATIEEQEQLRKIEAEIQTLSSRYSDFDQYKQQVFDLAGNRGYSLEDAYKIATYEDRMNAAANQARQETIRNLQQNAETSTGSLGADAPEQASGYLAMSREERRAFKERVKSGKI